MSPSKNFFFPFFYSSSSRPDYILEPGGREGEDRAE
jgi:hypothetical protein